VVGGQGVGDRHSDVGPVQGEPLVAQRVHQCHQVAGQGGGVIPSLGLAGQPDTALVDRDHRKSLASVGISIRHAYQVCGQPCTSSSGGPTPPVTACSRTSPVST
jgi:hypothetical protein